MASVEIEEEEETVELVRLEEKSLIENEPILIDDQRPLKKIKQEKKIIFLEKINNDRKNLIDTYFSNFFDPK